MRLAPPGVGGTRSAKRLAKTCQIRLSPGQSLFGAEHLEPSGPSSKTGRVTGSSRTASVESGTSSFSPFFVSGNITVFYDLRSVGSKSFSSPSRIRGITFFR